MGCNTSQEQKSSAGENGDVAANDRNETESKENKNGKKSADSAKSDKNKSSAKDAGEFVYFYLHTQCYNDSYVFA